MFNNIILFGNLVRDVECKVISDQLSICKFSIAHSKGVKKNDVWENQVTFVDCTYFSDKAKSLTKGTSVIISGHLKQENWTTPEGLNRSKLIIIVDDLLVASKATSFRNSDNETVVNKEFEQLESSKFNKINKMLESMELDVVSKNELPF